MAITGTVVKAWADGRKAYLAVKVTETEAGKPIAVEYIGETMLNDDDGLTKDDATLKAELVASVKDRRDAQTATSANPDITGTVEL